LRCGPARFKLRAHFSFQWNHRGSTGQWRSAGNLRRSKLFVKSPTKGLVIDRARCTSARRRISIEGEIYR
jgi:hypothetical protein